MVFAALGCYPGVGRGNPMATQCIVDWHFGQQSLAFLLWGLGTGTRTLNTHCTSLNVALAFP